MEQHRLKFDDFDVGALYKSAEEPRATIVFGHGAGASMEHTTLEQMTDAFAEVGLSSLRFNFPYMEAGKNRVDSVPVAAATFVAALELAQKRYPEPYFLGGHSFGGRMATHAVVEHELDVAGLIFGSFPLHTPGKPSLDRAAHMDAIGCPMLFMSGTRDGYVERKLINRLLRRLPADAQVKWLDTADHGYKVLKRTRKRKDDVFHEMGLHVNRFLNKVLAE